MEQARAALGVRPQTLYAYVSRGRIGVQPDPQDPRRSLYRAEDVDALVQRKADGRSRATLAATTLFGAEPSVPTAVCAIAGGRLYYRGREVAALAEHATLEQAAQCLWGCEAAVPLPGPGAAVAATLPEASTPGRVRVFTELALLAATGSSTRGRLPRVLLDEAAQLVGRVASAFGASSARSHEGWPLHLRLARGWKQPPAVAEQLRRALVLLADHELTSSAFSARITASTGASLPACLLAGLTTVSGPLHGDASARVRSLFEEVERDGPEVVVDRYLSAAVPLPGFGHRLYPDGDPRAAALLPDLDPPAHVARLIEHVARLTGQAPNIDVALAALAARHRLPPDAAFALFATARSVGLLAHAMEQLSVDSVIRPRGRYVGPPLEAPLVAANRPRRARA